MTRRFPAREIRPRGRKPECKLNIAEAPILWQAHPLALVAEARVADRFLVEFAASLLRARRIPQKADGLGHLN
jgi:hypothetical protein